MRLPHAERAYVDPRKLTEYLLARTHPVGRHKARVFEAMGFSGARPDELAAALHRVAVEGSVSGRRRSELGDRYIVDGVITAPRGGSVRLRTVWVLHPGSERPDFVTAYPLRRP